ncbi:YbhN family protein [Actinomadura sp. HBU206391]|uniref:lysylphosphatidylglycerol synthase transmembrane domain-containing protein n=1 Tax=Actinomadura sp. HBU206391 TaxID=2731692 RepID=UPI0016504D32|nr:lysylphosphatidylglycerol synthase domain-containing protein [Actinomadura sp. HBU206391]MBC6461122.1 flippase-like domain-containing protein [Actinomadura sp. HBU206391]
MEAIPFGRLHWGFLPVLVGLAALHYVFAARCMQAAARRRLPLRETLMTQFSAAAANRLTPAGLGAAAVNVRFLVCRGLTAGEAIAAVAAVQVVGAVADLLLFLVVVLAGHWTGGGGIDLLSATGAHVAGLAGRLPLPVRAGLVLGVAGALVWWCRSRRSGSPASALAGIADLARRPRDLLALLLASAATTLVMGTAFTVSVLAVPGAASPRQAQTLLIAYLLGAAAASVVPTPSGLGSTEAALVATLASADIAAGHAVQAVLLFRAITYWAPVPVGLLTTRPLRRRSEQSGARQHDPLPGVDIATVPMQAARPAAGTP